jgi:protease-4
MKHILCLMFALLLIVTGCAIVTIPLFPSERGLQERVLEGEGTAKILLVDISAVISEKERSKGLGLVTEDSLVARIKEELQKAEKDEYVKGVVVKINSPGGTVTATDTIYHELMEFKRRTDTRIVACVTGLAVSGGYYVASAADEIMAHPTSVTGNIGVIALKFNVDQLLSKVGIQEETVKSADKKDIWSPFRPSTPEEKEIIQSVIDTFHDRFVGVVHAGRKALLSKEEVDELADGRIFTAEQALAAKLVDKIGYLDDAVKAIKGSLDLKEAKVITYLRPGSYKGSIYSGLPQRSDTDINLIAVNGDFLSLIPEVRFMYLWRP